MGRRGGGRVAAGVVFACLALVLQACGQGAVEVPGGGGAAAVPTGSTAAEGTQGAEAGLEGSGLTTSTGQTAPGHVVEWAAAGPEVIAAFEQVKSQLGGRRVFVPGRLPAGAVVARGDEAAEWIALPAAGEVRVIVPGAGVLQFLEGVAGDVGDLPYRDAGSVCGCRAAVYELLGGTLVQWSYEGAWYGVYGRGFAEEVVVEVAGGMS